MDRNPLLFNKKLIIALIVFTLVFSSLGNLSSANIKYKSKTLEPLTDYSHNVFGEYFTLTTCVPCKYSHQALKNIYADGWHPFYYISYVSDKNNNSKQRKNELNVYGSPTTVWDGGWKYNIGGSGDTEQEMTKYNTSIIQCGARTVKDLDVDLNVVWLGAVNNHPTDGETEVSTDVVLDWTISEMRIEVEVTNNEIYDYDGHVHVQVTEVESEWWDDKFGNPYTFEFKDYAFNDNVSIDAESSWSETIYWDGCDYHDGDDPPRYFSHITQDNIQVLATLFDNDNNKHVDETAGFLCGTDTDPKTFDVYFGDSNPPSKIIINGSTMKYDPPGDLNWSTTYYWKVDVWNNLDELTPGEIWSFTTVVNSPPNIPSDPNPGDEVTDVDVNSDLSWNCSDPDGDDLTYDVYFEANDPSPDILVSNNQTEKTYDLLKLEYSTMYYWKIVAWDDLGESTSSPVWSFKTEDNAPPFPPGNPEPMDDATDVDVNAWLSWDGGDPDGDFVTYDVYFGDSYPPPFVIGNQTDMTFDPGTLDFDTGYYWRIVSWDYLGLMMAGNHWNFTTSSIPNNPPYVPSDPTPEDGATMVDIDADLSWVCGDPDEGDTVVYDVFFEAGDPDPDVKIADDISETSFDPGLLENGTVYYWWVKAVDNHYAVSNGPVWSFTTESRAPDVPFIDGPSRGKPGIEYSYTFVTTDPDGDDVSYFVDWGDGSNSSWLGPFVSGEEETVDHAWDEKGTYVIKAKAKDINGAEGDWSEFEITIPRSRVSSYHCFLERLPILSRYLYLLL